MDSESRPLQRREAAMKADSGQAEEGRVDSGVCAGCAGILYYYCG